MNFSAVDSEYWSDFVDPVILYVSVKHELLGFNFRLEEIIIRGFNNTEIVTQRLRRSLLYRYR